MVLTQLCSSTALPAAVCNRRQLILHAQPFLDGLSCSHGLEPNKDLVADACACSTEQQRTLVHRGSDALRDTLKAKLLPTMQLWLDTFEECKVRPGCICSCWHYSC